MRTPSHPPVLPLLLDARDVRNPVFCAHDACALHVNADDANVVGIGNWAPIDGLVFSRRRVGRVIYCDRCATLFPS